mmetsp:Transcript_6059/g.13408  ORF Transcript_6059/g.13408 Transcript_6059/m.13408 type:complete len:338 (-) Transcript_6059:105-1118(-)
MRVPALQLPPRPAITAAWDGADVEALGGQRNSLTQNETIAETSEEESFAAALLNGIDTNKESSKTGVDDGRATPVGPAATTTAAAAAAAAVAKVPLRKAATEGSIPIPALLEAEDLPGHEPTIQIEDPYRPPSWSWSETLEQFPALMRQYPLASVSEAMFDEDQSAVEEEVPIGVSLPEVGNTEKEKRTCIKGAVGVPPPSPQQNQGGDELLHGRQHSHKSAEDGCPSHREPALSEAWEAIWKAQKHVEQRALEVAQREMAVQEAEAANIAMAKRLNELRSELDRYGQQLEEGMLSLNAQQAWVKQMCLGGAQIEADTTTTARSSRRRGSSRQSAQG